MYSISFITFQERFDWRKRNSEGKYLPYKKQNLAVGRRALHAQTVKENPSFFFVPFILIWNTEKSAGCFFFQNSLQRTCGQNERFQQLNNAGVKEGHRDVG